MTEDRHSRMAREMAEKLAKRLIREGKLIESGAAIHDKMFLPPGAPRELREEVRFAFHAGAQHLWGSIFGVLDAGEKETAADMERMDMIHAEIAAWLATAHARRRFW